MTPSWGMVQESSRCNGSPRINSACSVTDLPVFRDAHQAASLPGRRRRPGRASTMPERISRTLSTREGPVEKAGREDRRGHWQGPDGTADDGLTSPPRSPIIARWSAAGGRGRIYAHLPRVPRRTMRLIDLHVDWPLQGAQERRMVFDPAPLSPEPRERTGPWLDGYLQATKPPFSPVIGGADDWATQTATPGPPLGQLIDKARGRISRPAPLIGLRRFRPLAGRPRRLGLGDGRGRRIRRLDPLDRRPGTPPGLVRARSAALSASLRHR